VDKVTVLGIKKLLWDVYGVDWVARVGGVNSLNAMMGFYFKNLDN
jgi:hypothetical protein